MYPVADLVLSEKQALVGVQAEMELGGWVDNLGCVQVFQ